MDCSRLYCCTIYIIIFLKACKKKEKKREIWSIFLFFIFNLNKRKKKKKKKKKICYRYFIYLCYSETTKFRKIKRNLIYSN